MNQVGQNLITFSRKITTRPLDKEGSDISTIYSALSKAMKNSQLLIVDNKVGTKINVIDPSSGAHFFRSSLLSPSLARSLSHSPRSSSFLNLLITLSIDLFS